MRDLTDEEQKRFDNGQAFCISVGLTPMTKENFINITDSFNASKNINQSLKSFQNATKVVSEIMGGMVTISMAKDSFDKFQEYVNSYNIEQELMSDEINLGDSVTDSVTRFKGVVVSLQTHLNEETTAKVQPICKKNTGFLPKAEWFQIERLEK